MIQFEVKFQSFDDLDEHEQAGASNNGNGKECATYLRVFRNGKTEFLESDAMEPEDARLSRDLSWVKKAIEFAYRCGREDGQRDERRANDQS